MRARALCSVILLGFLAVPFIADAQVVRTMARLPIPELAEARVNSMVTDEVGALWLGTNKGLYRFDGAEVERYVSDPRDPDALPYDDVYQLHRDEEGAIWAATFRGVWRIDPITGERRAVPFLVGDRTVLARECTWITAARNGGLWAFGLNAVFLLEKRDSVFRQVLPLVERQMYAVGGSEDAEGVLWYCDRTILRSYDPRSGKEAEYVFKPDGGVAPPKTLLTKVIHDRYDPDVLWCTSWGLGLVRFNKRTHEFATPFVLDRPLGDLSNIVFNAVQVDRDRWYAVVNERLYQLEGEHDRLLEVRDGSDAGGVQAVSVMDRGPGGLFVGAIGTVQVLGPSADAFRSLSGILNAPNIHAFPSVDGGGYWVTRFYSDRALFRTDRDGAILERIEFPESDRTFEAFRVCQDHQGTVWLGTTRGLIRYTPGAHAMEWQPVVLRDQPDDRPFILDVLERDDGLWLVLGVQGLARVDPVGGELNHVELPAELATANVGVVALKPLDKDRSFVILDRMPPMLLDHRSLKLHVIGVDPRTAVEFTGIVSAEVQDSGRIVLSTRSQGLLRIALDPGSNSWRIDRRWYLPDRPTFNESARDAQGRLWFTSDRGLFVLDPATDVLHRIDPLHGAPDLLNMHVMSLMSGDMLVSGAGYHVVTSSFTPDHAAPKLLVRTITAGDRSVPLSGSNGSPLHLSYSDNDLAITFGAIALLDGDALSYAYCIVVDDAPGTWKELGAKRALDLVGLPPGHYRIELRAAGLTADPVHTAFAFMVDPPLWGTWWARAIMLLAGIVLVVMGTRYFLTLRLRRRVRELEREREIERVRSRISRDIHDGIGSGLTKITMLSRQLQAEVGPQAERIAIASTELVNELGEIVWTVDPRNDDFASFAAYVRNSLGKQFENAPVELNLVIELAPEDARRMLGPEVKRQVILTLKEAVNNALRHANAKEVSVTLSLRKDQLNLVVSDDGKGFDPSKVREGANGLINFRKRAELLNGTVAIDTAATGTRITLHAPLPSTKM